MVTVGIALVAIGIVLIAIGSAVVVSKRGTTTRGGAELSDGRQTTSSRGVGGARVGVSKEKSASFRVTANLSVEETAAMAAEGDMALPRAMMVIVAGFSVLCLGSAALLFATGSPLVMALGGLFGLYGVVLPIKFLQKARVSDPGIG